MRMIPDTPHGTHSQAEKRIFDRLRVISFDEKQGIFTAYHSLNLTRHAYKRFGEIDFLICCSKGLYAIEVKGGGVSYKEGTWYYRNRYGDDNTSREGPFKQVESALHGLMKNLRANLPDRVISQFSIGYGVIFPDCEWRVSGSEWDPHTLADVRGSKNLERWLRKLFQYWRSKDGGNRHPDSVALKTLRRYLRPEFESVVPLHVQAQAAEDRIARLTEDQMAMVDVVAANPRVLCSGGAGTGKTFLAMELARRWTAEGMNVLLACRSPWLKNYLAARFAIPKLTLSLAASTRMACRRAGLDQFDALIVDEGQDLFDMGSLDKLDSVLAGGLAEGRWCLFHDINNQSGLLNRPDQEAIEYLESLRPAQVPLRTNCRNTRVILEKVQTSLGADMGTRGAGEGPRIREHETTSREEAGKLLANEIAELVDHGGLAPGDVTILSPDSFENSCAVDLPKKIRKGIMTLDEYSVKSFPARQISYAKIRDFKGLENEAIILVDLPPPSREDGDIAAHYVAMSRARSVLSLVYRSTR
ncbi:nuclease [bacterium endosymbiont of Escarpia laminata]|nr:MAG: nuclease [bacterium endosymbiont of Escarpia laminata]RLJ20735.1 MAG: nuclease [bacterium endosymbiont of Escarpia laminata]